MRCEKRGEKNNTPCGKNSRPPVENWALRAFPIFAGLNYRSPPFIDSFYPLHACALEQVRMEKKKKKIIETDAEINFSSRSRIV